MDLPLLVNLYRFHPELMKFISRVIYEDILTCAVPLEYRIELLSLFPWPDPNIPRCWIPSCHKDTQIGHSRNNHPMVTKCVQYALLHGLNIHDIGILVQYNSAKVHLTSMLHQNGIPDVDDETVQPTDAAQRCSRKLVILAC